MKPGSSGKCYHLDLDWIEWRQGRGIVAFVETSLFYPNGRFTQKEILDYYKKFHVKVYGELAELANRPAYFVFYSKELTQFWLYRLHNGDYEYLKTLHENEYRHFIRGL